MYTQRPPKKRSTNITLAGMALVAALLIGGIFFVGRNDPLNDKPTTKSTAKVQKPATKKPAPVNLQPTVDAWVAGQKGAYSIVVYDPDNATTIASYQPDKQYFTASIYKLFVVYLALQDIDKGVHTMNEPFKYGKTREKCMYDAIHDSDSPCGEALLADLGNDTVNKRLKDYGITGTSFPAFLTTAQDSVTILKRLQSRKDLSETSTAFLVDAMSTQIYRDGIPAGMPEAKVADKIGFYETGWHDSAVITLPDGRQYIMVVLTKDAGSKQIADLSRSVYTKLIEAEHSVTP